VARPDPPTFRCRECDGALTTAAALRSRIEEAAVTEIWAAARRRGTESPSRARDAIGLMTRLNPTVSEHLVETRPLPGVVTFIWFDRVSSRNFLGCRIAKGIPGSIWKRFIFVQRVNVRDKIEDDLHPMSWRYPTDVWFSIVGRGNSSVEPALKPRRLTRGLERNRRATCSLRSNGGGRRPLNRKAVRTAPLKVKKPRLEEIERGLRRAHPPCWITRPGQIRDAEC